MWAASPFGGFSEDVFILSRIPNPAKTEPPGRGRRGQTYLMCQNDSIAAKYLPQPVLQCVGIPVSPQQGAADATSRPTNL